MKLKNLLFLSLFVTTCIFAKNSPAKVSRHKHAPAVTINGLYKFSGKLNNRISIFMWFIVKDSVLKGEVTYLKTAKRTPITIAGVIDKDGLNLYEFGRSGIITGVYHGTFNTNTFTGNWHAPQSDKELTYNLTPKDTVLTLGDIELKPLLIDGAYNYQFGKAGGGGLINLKHINGSEYFMELNAVTQAPQNNVAEIERVKVKMIKNTIYYEAPGADSNCRYRIRIFKGFVVIDRLSEFGGCFGMGAGPEGVFIKTSDKAEFAF